MSEIDNFEKLLYCLSGYIEDYNDRNYGDADNWMRHVRIAWEGVIESHPESLNPYEVYIMELKNK